MYSFEKKEISSIYMFVNSLRIMAKAMLATSFPKLDEATKSIWSR